ncbi:hypothetical protein MKW92_007388 [Papaver armeniacum]|nr:hypothetical protein MKW92_007388 [Papaver armeniacum]
MSGGRIDPDWPANNKIRKTFLNSSKKKIKRFSRRVCYTQKYIRAAEVCVAATLTETHRMTSSERKAMSILKEFEEQCATPIGKLRQVANAMTAEMHAGLASEGGSKLKMDARVVKKEFTEVSIPPELMTATSSELFDFIAKELARFIATEGEGFFLPPGRTLIRWTKGFSIDDAVDKDVVVELTKALDRQGIDMRVAALVNDNWYISWRQILQQ